jgi:HAD superfamily hydrolase (TIGR01490 family)
MMALAIFDLDNTLLAGDSDHAWGEFLVAQGQVPAADYAQANDYFYAQYQKGQLDIEEYVAFVVKPLQQLSPQQRESLRAEFIHTKVQPMIAAGTADLLARHRAAQDELLIITATIDFITAPIAQLLGVQHLLATVPEQTEAGDFTGKIAGVPAFQNGKITRLEQWLSAQNAHFDQQWFYSDSHNDLPLLEKVTNPVAVNPDETLANHAKTQGWPVISLR